MPTDPFGIPPAPDQTGISGIGVRRSQGGQPRGIKEALGYGLMGASDIAQASLPGFIQSAGEAQNASQAFAGGLGIGLIGSLGAPGRAAALQQEKHEKATQDFQTHVIQTGMKYMDNDSIEKLFKDVGLGDIKTKPEKLNLAMYNQTVRGLVAAYLRKGQSKENIAELGDTLRQIPELSDLMSQLDVEPTTGSAITPYERARGIFTPESYAAFLKSQDPNDLVPKKSGGKETLSDYKLNQYKDDRAELERVARERGYFDESGKLNLDAAKEEVFAGDQNREAMYDNVSGVSTARPPNLRIEATRIAAANWQWRLLPKPQQDKQVEDIMKQLEASAPQASARSAAFEPRKPGEIFSPQNMSGPSPEAKANRSAAIRGFILSEYGKLPAGTPHTLSAINGIWNSQDPETRAELEQAAQSAIQKSKENGGRYLATSQEGMEYLSRIGFPFIPPAMPGMVPQGMDEEDQPAIEPLPGEDEMSMEEQDLQP